MSVPENFYTNKSLAYSGLLQSLKSKLRWYGWYRFLAFLFIFVPIFFTGFSWLGIGSAVVFFFLFLFLVKKNISLEKEKKRTTVLLQLIDDELLAIRHSFLHFAEGNEFLDPKHFFSYDLDLFGKGSLFQFLNRTSTAGGKSILAKWLQYPFVNQPEIEQQQEAIRELSQHPEWRLNFLAEGKLFEETSETDEEIRSWSEMELSIPNSGKLKYLLWGVPSLTLLSIIPAATGGSNLFLYFMLLVQWLLLFSFWKSITHFYRFFGRKSELLSKYMYLLQKIEHAEFSSRLLQDHRQKLHQPSAVHAFSELKSLVKEFEYRQNMLVGLVLNSFFLWDIRCTYKLWRWHKKYHSELRVWLSVIAETDALISLANYADNRPAFVYPEIVEGDFEYSCTDLGHPLLSPDKRVNNDFEIRNWSKVLVVTGANMAGKSTFLRTVGVNLILARLGAPVCAKSMKVSPVNLYTNMRTTDSLLDDESYFFAELRRIKTVLDRLKKGERYFVILDEMLKGTNSVDKLNGSKELIRKLLHLNAVALIATHDLKLSEMEKEFPEQVSNKCFEIRIENDELIFDYTLSDGVTKTMNATFLMKKMGII